MQSIKVRRGAHSNVLLLPPCLLTFLMLSFPSSLLTNERNMDLQPAAS